MDGAVLREAWWGSIVLGEFWSELVEEVELSGGGGTDSFLSCVLSIICLNGHTDMTCKHMSW